MEIPAETVDIMYTAGTIYLLIYFTRHALDINFLAPFSRVILEFVYDEQPDSYLTLNTPYAVSGFHQLCHSSIKDNQKVSGKYKNGLKCKCENIYCFVFGANCVSMMMENSGGKSFRYSFEVFPLYFSISISFHFMLTFRLLHFTQERVSLLYSSLILFHSLFFI